MSHRQNSGLETPHEDATLSEVPEEFGAPGAEVSVLNALTSQTPWWVVSVIFHGLMILLVGLLSLTINIDSDEEPMITVGPITPSAKSEIREAPKTPPGDALVPAAFDPSKPVSN